MKRFKKLLLLLLIILLLTPYLGTPALTAAYAVELAVPTGLGAEVFQNHIRLRWQNNNNNNYYNTVIEKSIDQGNFYTITTLPKGTSEYKDYSISNGHVYTYRARNVYGSSKSTYTPEVEAITFYPTSFTVAHAYSDQVDLEWTYPTLPLLRTPEYQTVIERRLTSKSSWEVIATLPASETTYRDKTVSNDTAYYYRIRTKYANDNYSKYVPSDWGIYTRTGYPLSTALWGYALSDNRIKLEWDMSLADGGRAILQKKDIAGNFYNLSTSEYYNTYIDEYLTKGRTYTYRLKMQSKNGLSSEFSEEINIIAEMVPHPSDLSATTLSADRIALTWNYPYDVETGFEIWRKDTITWTLIATVPKNSDSFTDHNVKGGVSYTYRVRAIRGETAFSAFSLDKTIYNAFPVTPKAPVGYTSEGILRLFSTDEVPRGTLYTLEYKDHINSEWKDYKSVSQGLLIAYIFYSAQDEFYFRIRSNVGSLASYSPEYHFYGSSPDPVQKLSAPLVGFERISLTWKDTGSKSEGYKIYRTANNNRELIETVTRIEYNDEMSFTDEAPIPGSVSRYEVLAYNASGESKVQAISVTVPKAFKFNDISAYTWAHEAIYTLSGLGALDYQNGNFEPEKALTRGQMTRLALRAFEFSYDPQGLSPLTDLYAGHTYYQDLKTAVKLGLLYPDVQGKIYPDQAVTRRELVLFLNNCLNALGRPLSTLDQEYLQGFVDYDTISANEAPIMASFVGDGLVSGKSGGRLGLSDRTSKVEGVAIIYRTMRRYK